MTNPISPKFNRPDPRLAEVETTPQANSWKNIGRAIALFTPLALGAIALGGMAASLAVAAENPTHSDELSSTVFFSNASIVLPSLLPAIPAIMGPSIRNFFENQQGHIEEIQTTPQSDLISINMIEPSVSSLTDSNAEKIKEHQEELEVFKEKFNELGMLHHNQKFIDKFSSLISPGLLPHEIINSLLISDKNDDEIYSWLEVILNILLLKDPNFKPSYLIYKEIMRGRFQKNSDLINRLKESGLESYAHSYYDVAFALNRPGIFPPAKNPISTEDYSLNFLWVNMNPQDRVHDTALHIFNKEWDDYETNESVNSENHPCKNVPVEDDWEFPFCSNGSKSYMLLKWAEKNPNAQMRLWYDSALVTHQAQRNTFTTLQTIAKSKQVNLKLKDIRKLSNIRGELANALHPGTPLYFRVDLLKALISDHLMNDPKEREKYLVISDLDVTPMSSEELFDQRTINHLDTAGYVFNRVSPRRFENNFFIFNKENPELSEIHNQTILQPIIRRIESLRFHDEEQRLFSESVYGQYEEFLRAMVKWEREGNLSQFIQGPWKSNINAPRKVIKTPKSQFQNNKFGLDNHQTEMFRFIGESDNTPFVCNGRSASKKDRYGICYEQPISALGDWKPEPLEDPENDLTAEVSG